MGKVETYYCDRCKKEISLKDKNKTEAACNFNLSISDMKNHRLIGHLRLLLCEDCSKSFDEWVGSYQSTEVHDNASDQNDFFEDSFF